MGVSVVGNGVGIEVGEGIGDPVGVRVKGIAVGVGSDVGLGDSVEGEHADTSRTKVENADIISKYR